MQSHLALSPRRPCGVGKAAPKVVILSIPYPPIPAEPTLKSRLEALLNSIPRFIDRATRSTESFAESVPANVKSLFSKDGPLGALQFWRDNRENIQQTTDALLDTGESIVRGDSEQFRENASRLNLRFLKDLQDGSEMNVVRMVHRVTLFAVDALTPWDFDRHDFGITFVTKWDDVETGDLTNHVKLTSTIKPLEGEWKVTGRTKLLELGDGAVVFGKAGIYLAGDHPAYVGVEADRVWRIPRVDGTKLFLNVNYRSSRKPDVDPFKMTLGLQQDFDIAKGVVLTLRIGANPLEADKLFVTPVASGEYF